MKKKILIFCDFYLPGYKSGGGMWTVVNLVDRFSGTHDFYVVTRNYESKGDTEPYTSVRSGAWNSVGNAQVFYLAKEHYSLKTFIALVSEVAPDAVFLNSAFSMPVVKFLIARRKRLVPTVPVILAPCGEFSAGALSIKPIKKKLFLTYAKAVGMYDDVIWKASFDAEKDEIARLIGRDSEIFVAPDLAPRSILPGFDIDSKPHKPTGSARFVLLSRIARKKNIHYFIERLADIDSGDITVDLLGPVEDEEYWNECLTAARRLPSFINVNAEAAFIPYEDGLRRMVESHFFVLPTLGENFGYVFLEAMAAGAPLLVSDKTVWGELEKRNAGWQVSLESPHAWVEKIKMCVEMDPASYREMSRNARQYAMDWLENDQTERATAKVFERALSGRTVGCER
jgi:glycosyltransferase involved in cell wall biosynthesis